MPWGDWASSMHGVQLLPTNQRSKNLGTVRAGRSSINSNPIVPAPARDLRAICTAFPARNVDPNAAAPSKADKEAFEAASLKGTFSENDHVVLLICGGNNSLDSWLEYRGVFG